mmetsp:Transcript_2801/g.3722  ORF Transcript_2801/g.3722 Transcript_2801/m.3722 type:complete len:229 (-) Transcript_2801:57-743(-)
METFVHLTVKFVFRTVTCWRETFIWHKPQHSATQPRMLKHVFAFVLVIALFLSFASVTSAGSIKCFADTWYDSSRPNVNFAHDIFGYYNRKYPAPYADYAIVSLWNITSVPNTVSWANLTYMQNGISGDEYFGPAYTLNVWQTVTNWTETGPTWNNRPARIYSQIVGDYQDGDVQYIMVPVGPQINDAKARNDTFISFEIWGETWWPRQQVIMRDHTNPDYTPFLIWG